MLEILRLDEENYEGTYVIDTSQAWRGSVVYVSGVSAEGKFKLDLPKTAANRAVCRGLVTYYPMIETGSDTAVAVDKITKGKPVVYLTGPGEFKLGPTLGTDGPLVATSFSKWFSGSTLHTVAAYTATAFDKSCFVGFTTGNYGKFVGGYITGTGITKHTAQSSVFYGAQFRVRGLYGDTASGVTVWLDVDWNRFNYSTAGLGLL